jgi:hypothetical protein
MIYQNKNYTVEIGESQILEEAQVYLCRNRETGVIEAEEQMLPRIVDYANQLNQELERMRKEGELSGGSNVVDLDSMKPH